MSSTGTVMVQSSERSQRSVRLQVARVRLSGHRGSVDAKVLFETGSDRSYVSSDAVKAIGPEWLGSYYHAYTAFGSGTSS